ncbi:MAG: transglutaminase domain-containing protein [Thermoanaerobaculia bacterium]
MILTNLFLLFGVLAAPASRNFDATFVASVEDIPAGLHRLEVWVPLLQDTPEQIIKDLKIDSSYPGEVRRENAFGNSYFYFSTESPKPGKLEIRVSFAAQRQEVLHSRLVPARGGLLPEERARYLKEENLVTISPRIRDLARRITYGITTAEGKARAIYDYVVNTMTYDKTVPGWGNGDTERACDVAKGNCTDFHSLFMSLARSEDIPARFVIGFPLKPDAEGIIPGYHCWAEFYLPDRGWVPVDASDASKATDPKRRDFLFGNLDPDRIQFTVGREIRLDPPPCAETLNYFIYPHAEGDGRPITPVAVRMEYKNRALSASVASAF